MRGGTVGLISLERHNLEDGIDFTPVQNNTDDYASMVAGVLPGGQFGFNQLGSLPPAGSCTFYAAAGQTVGPSYRPLLLSALSGGTLVPAAAGLSISNGTASAIAGLVSGVDMAPLAGTEDANSTLFLDGSAFTVTGTASSTVGAFQATVPPAIPFVWTNREQITNVNRSHNLTLTWSGSGNGTVLVVGGNYDQPNNASGAFLCAASLAAGTITVPSYVMEGLPPSRSFLQQSAGYIQMTVMPASPASFTATGLTAGLAWSLLWNDQTVLFQ